MLIYLIKFFLVLVWNKKLLSEKVYKSFLQSLVRILIQSANKYICWLKNFIKFGCYRLKSCDLQPIAIYFDHYFVFPLKILHPNKLYSDCFLDFFLNHFPFETLSLKIVEGLNNMIFHQSEKDQENFNVSRHLFVVCSTLSSKSGH